MQQSKFIAQTSIPASLVRAVSRQVGGWKELQRIAEDVARNGANVGWSGFTYYADTVKFFHRNRADIVAFLESQAEGVGYESHLQMVFEFRGLDASYGEIALALYSDSLKQLFDKNTQVANAIAWYVLEQVASDVADFAG